MVMVGHETPGENRERIAIVGVQKGALQFVHVFFCAENGLSVVAAHADVIIGVWVKLASSRHGQPPSDRAASAK